MLDRSHWMAHIIAVILRIAIASVAATVILVVAPDASAQFSDRPIDLRPETSGQPVDEVEVVLEGAEPRLAFHRALSMWTDTRVAVINGRPAIRMETRYELDALCQAPCEVRLPRGPLQLALSRPGGDARVSNAMLTVSGPMRIRGTYVDNEGLRNAGIVSLLFGAAAVGVGLGVGMPMLSSANAEEQTLGLGVLIGGVAMSAVLQVAGLILGLREDGAVFEVRS